MALRNPQICSISPVQLTSTLADHSKKVRIIDCRSFLEYNDNHVVGAVNICCSKLIKRRLQQEKISLKDLLVHCRIEVDETSDVVVYDQRSQSVEEVSLDSFIYVLLKKLILVFEKVHLLSGGFVGFQTLYPEFCENKIWKYPGLTALSQPCLPTTTSGPTRILPFLYLGSEDDANNKELLQSHNITYELNVSNKCPKPDFIPDGHFLRIPVNDSNNEKLLPFFVQAFQFVDKARESNESVLVHCLAGISRSPTVAIAYVMRHLQMTCEDAYRYVKSKRATISPNFNFLGQLLEYEKQLVQDKVIEKKPQQQSSFASSASQSPDYFLGPHMASSPPPVVTRPMGKRVNLSLRFTSFGDPPNLSSPQDSSPTTAMARLQFEKPLGKENRTSSSTSGTGIPPSSGLSLGFSSLARPTRLVKEQNVTSIQEEEMNQWESVTKSVTTRQSLSFSFSKGFKSRKSSIEQYQQQFSEQSSASASATNTTCNAEDEGSEHGKKFKVHKIYVEGMNTKGKEDDLKTDLIPSSSSGASIGSEEIQTSSLNSPIGCYRRDFSRSDSVSTSGIGSEISENDLQASGSWEMTESGSGGDDGVFSDTYSIRSKSPKPPRQLQLWSSDSGHWSSADDGLSCTSSSAEVPASLTFGDAKSPEKRKCTEALFPNYGLNLSNLEKRRSYAGGGTPGSEWCSDVSRPKRWSIATEEAVDPESNPSCSEGVFGGKIRPLHADEKEKSKSQGMSEGNSCSGTSNHLQFGTHWFNLLSGSELTCCERQGDGLYRVHSCPGIVGYRDWLQIQQNVPDSPPDHEPISDSVLLKMRSCCHRTKHERSFEHAVSSHPWNKNRFSCGNIDYDELLCKLQGVQDAKTDSSHSSSSTLASSSFSIVVQ